METIICDLINNIKQNIVHDMEFRSDDYFVGIILKAYNRYQEDEYDSVDYIFSLNDNKDLACCLEGGMTAKEIARMYYDMRAHKYTPYFYFGVNHKEPIQITSIEKVKTTLIAYLSEVLPCVLAYPYIDGYKELYKHCMSDYMINNQLVP